MGTCTTCAHRDTSKGEGSLECQNPVAVIKEATYQTYQFYEQEGDLPDLSKVVELLNSSCIEDIGCQFADWLKMMTYCKRAAYYFRPGYFSHTNLKEKDLAVQSTLNKGKHVIHHLAMYGRKLIVQLQASTSLRIACAAAKYDTLNVKQQQELSWVLAAVTYRLLAYLPPSLEFVRDAMLDEFLVFGNFLAGSPHVATCVTALLEMHGVTSSLHLTVLLDKYM